MSQENDSDNNNSSKKDGESSEDEEKQINFRASKEQKENWENYVEDSNGEYQSVSHFLRRAAEKEIAGRHTKNGSEPRKLDNSPNPVIVEKLDDLSDQLRSIERRLSVLEADQYGNENISELTTQIWQVLPQSKHEITLGLIGRGEVEPNEGVDPNSPPYSEVDTTGSIDDLAEVLDADPSAVEMAIQRLKKNTNFLGWDERGDTMYYFRHE